MNKKEIKAYIKQEARKELARRSFWHYCKYTSPEFYKDNRKHLKRLCNTLQALKEKQLTKPNGEYFTKLIIKMPPQHGKSRTLVKFTQWCLGINNKERIITASYNDSAAGDFAKYTRDGMMEEKNIEDNSYLLFSEIFDSKIKRGSASYYKWALEGQHFNYLGVGVGGGVTGKGATIRICDDLVKGAEEALNEHHLNKIWTWFTNTFSSRNSAEDGEVLEIMVMTPWSKKDPIGMIQEHENNDWYILEFEAMDENGDMLCDEILNVAAYETIKKRASINAVTASIFWANYHNKTIDSAGRLYQSFKTYNKLPLDENGQSLLEQVCCYTDTADTGQDYLCSLIYGIYNKEAYILDIIYTKNAMEVTEKQLSNKLHEHQVNNAYIESNNGGRGFARAVENILRNEYKNYHVLVNWFHQSRNKKARILTNASWIQEHVYYPSNWIDRFPEYAKSMLEYQREGNNKNDDAQDATTGISEHIAEKINIGPVHVVI
jgi:predicted phage terminase large subunit-like protein